MPPGVVCFKTEVVMVDRGDTVRVVVGHGRTYLKMAVVGESQVDVATGRALTVSVYVYASAVMVVWAN